MEKHFEFLHSRSLFLVCFSFFFFFTLCKYVHYSNVYQTILTEQIWSFLLTPAKSVCHIAAICIRICLCEYCSILVMNASKCAWSPFDNRKLHMYMWVWIALVFQYLSKSQLELANQNSNGNRHFPLLFGSIQPKWPITKIHFIG